MSAARPFHIEELHLSGFRAFAKTRLQLGDFTVLVGRNGVGKSTLVDALEFLREALTDSLEAALERRGGLEALLHRGPRESSHLSVALGVRLSTAYLREVRRTTGLPLPLPRSRAGATVTYGFRVVPARGRARFSVDSEVSQAMDWGFHRSGSPPWNVWGCSVPPGLRAPSRRSLLLPLAAQHDGLHRALLDALTTSCRVYRPSPEALRVEPPTSGAVLLNQDGSNAGDVLHHLARRKEDVEWVARHLAAVTPGLVGVRASAAAGRCLLRFHLRQGPGSRAGTELDVRAVSDGTLRALVLLLALRQRPTPALVCMEKLEASLHPSAISVVMEAAEASTHRCQVLLATYSPEALAHPAVTSARVRVVVSREGRSRILTPRADVAEPALLRRFLGALLTESELSPAEESKYLEEDYLVAV
ncbi:AAA family ATPase [Vitiosangium sp. GDMCC 1.1324]|uniref:AAA family ATPase n=1 Tax=Vitiosangium sp. (strain GDMCC 1.1324) TaxID=2138576 RepID=UPI0011B5AA78|nr:AAA family ATPase [Vitiosangium sp. GDMCC 1.1324]